MHPTFGYMKSKIICICGAGTMGSGIAQVAATAGFSTLLFDVNETILQQATDSIKSSLQKLEEKGKLQEPAIAILQRITFTNEMEKCRGNVIIEAIVEKQDVKISLFRQLAERNTADTIFASNTSSLSITELGAEIPNPERFAGLHFFNPAPLMKLVEVVTGEQTSEEVIQFLLELTKAFGKTPVRCKDAPGFIVNRVARPYYIEALRIAEEGKITLEEIDQLLESRGFKLGPFKLMDLIGNDINYAVSCSVFDQLQQPERLRPSYLQEEKVSKKELGKKTGKGYYQYDK